MHKKTIDEAQAELDEEINDETVCQIELGYPKFIAIERAMKIVRERRQRKISHLFKED